MAKGNHLDITRNLFYWFRGPDGDGTAARQLENNLTKSLVSLLEHCDRKVVLGSFLRKLGLSSSDEIGFSLQRRPPMARTSGRRLILGITGGPADLVDGEALHDGRPDAWIFGPSWTVLVESKLGDRLTAAQLHAHARSAGWVRGYTTEQTTWNELHRLLRPALSRLHKKDSVSRLLLQEWLTYLEYQNMVDFEKLEPIDFDFFNLPPDQRRPLLSTMKKRVRTFAAMIGRKPPAKRIAGLYTERQVDQWKYGDHHAEGRGGWFNIGGDPSPAHWHVTVFHEPDGLLISVINSHTHLTRRLCRSPGALHDILKLVDGVNMTIACRRAWYANPKSPYKGRRIIRSDEPLVINASMLNRNGLVPELLSETLLQLLKSRKWRAELVVSVPIPRSSLLRMSCQGQVDAVAKAIGRIGPIHSRLVATERA